MKFIITNIEWDTDGDMDAFFSLPQEVMVKVDDEDDIADDLSDLYYGWCVKSFKATPY